MIGRDDFLNNAGGNGEGIKLPFALDKLMNSLMKQLSKEFNNMGESKEFNNSQKIPRGFKIQISSGNPQVKDIHPQQIRRIQRKPIQKEEISEKEMKRRSKLPKEEAESNVKRLSDRLIYEINVPDVKLKEDVVVTKLEDSVEVRAYSKNKCFFKIIPLKVEIIGYALKDDKLLLELKN
jgi:hypothetical protein